MKRRRIFAPLSGCAVVALTLAACGGVMSTSTPGMLVLESTPAQVVVFVDDVAVPVRDIGEERVVLLAPGSRRVMLAADAHLPYLFELRVSPGERLSLVIELWPVERDLDSPEPD
jgi:hypothetical protein